MAYIHIPDFTKTNTLDNDTEFVIVIDGVEYLVTFKTLSDKFGNTPELLQQINAEIEALRAIVDAFPTDNPAAPKALKISDNPIIDGIYKPTEAGTYPDAGGLEYDPTEGITYFIRTQGVWTKDVTPINFTPTGVVEEGNTQAVSGGEVFDKTMTKEVYLRIEESENIFDKTKSTIGKRIENGTGNIIDFPNGEISDYMEIKHLEYFRYGAVSNHAIFEKKGDTVPIRYGWSQQITINPEEIGKYLVVNTTVTGDFENKNIVQVVPRYLGSTPSEYIPYYKRELIKEEYIKKDNVLKMNYSPDFEFGYINTTGNDTGNIFFNSYRSANFLKIRNVNKLNITFNVANDDDGYTYEASLFQYDNECKFIEKVNINTGEGDYELNPKTSHVKFMVNKRPVEGSVYDSQKISKNDFSLSFSLEASEQVDEVKNIRSSEYIELRYEFSKGIPCDIEEEDIEDPVYMFEEHRLGYGYLMLPNNYRNVGEKTRLIIFAHGSANTKPDLGIYKPYVDYLVAQGYAVADCHAWGSIYGPGSLPYATQFWGTPTNYAAYQAFYKKLQQKFNLHSEIFLFGKSQGGLQVYGLPYKTNIPIKACALLASAVNPLGNQYGYNDADRFACFEDFGFSGLEKDSEGNYIGEAVVMKKASVSDYSWTQPRIDYFIKNKNKWMQWNVPMAGVIGLDENFDKFFPSLSNLDDVTKVAKVPFICFVAKDDLYNNNLNMQKAIKNSGGVYIMRLLPSGNIDPHHVTDTTGPKVNNVITQSGEVFNDVPVAFVEMLEFFKLYE